MSVSYAGAPLRGLYFVSPDATFKRKPYEVWSYYDINQVFAFVDETGFGDYRLSTPLWEVWRRPR